MGSLQLFLKRKNYTNAEYNPVWQIMCGVGGNLWDNGNVGHVNLHMWWGDIELSTHPHTNKSKAGKVE